MTKFSKTELDITGYKPKMKPVYIGKPSDLRAIPFEAGKTTVQVKADGEFSWIHVDKATAYAVNRFGRKTEDLPALSELHKGVLRVKPVLEAEILAELYGVDENGKPVSLPNFIHYLKGDNKALQERIRIGMFDLIKVKMHKEEFSPQKNLNAAKRFELLSRFQADAVLPYIVPKDISEIEEYWKQKVQGEGWEGLVIRTNGDTYKAKPNRDIDAVIIGINKNTKGYEKELAKSVKVALLCDNGSFVELGDTVIPDEAEAKQLFALTRVKVNEDANTVYVKPLVIVKVSYISLFPETTNRVYKLLLGGFTEVGTMTLARMKSPRVVGYRKDKQVIVTDVGINQIGE